MFDCIKNLSRDHNSRVRQHRQNKIMRWYMARKSWTQ